MPGYGIWKVIDSKAESHPKGTLVIGWSGWSEYGIANAKESQIINEIPGVSITHYLGALGGTGWTAYYGLVSSSKAFMFIIKSLENRATVLGHNIIRINED